MRDTPGTMSESEKPDRGDLLTGYAVCERILGFGGHTRYFVRHATLPSCLRSNQRLGRPIRTGVRYPSRCSIIERSPGVSTVIVGLEWEVKT